MKYIGLPRPSYPLGAIIKPAFQMTPDYRIKIENEIKDYLKSFKDVDEILNIKCENTFDDLGLQINVWNVKTSKEAFWVVEGESVPMNIYTQNAQYLSADEAYSYHLGISQRLNKRSQDGFKHIIDELPLDIERLQSINRKLNMASEKLAINLEPEEFQSIGLLCRESLIDLSKELCKRNPELVAEKGLKIADFKGVTSEFINLYIPGEKNSELRNYSRKLADCAWSYDCSIVHSQNKTYPDVKIALLFTSSVVSLMENLFFKYIGFDDEPVCNSCGSKQLDFFEADNDRVIVKCNACDNEFLLENN
jgi:hypothetical protein